MSKLFGGMEVRQRSVVISRMRLIRMQRGIPDPFSEARALREQINRFRNWFDNKIHEIKRERKRICGKIIWYQNAPFLDIDVQRNADRNWFLFTSYSGLRGDYSLRELGQLVGLGVERVRQIVAKLENSYVKTFGKDTWRKRLICDESWTPEQQYREFLELTSE